MKEIDFSPAKISEAEKNRLLIKAVNDRPNAATSYGKAKLNSTETKDIFDKPFEMNVERHNALVDKVIELQAEVRDAIEKHESDVAVEIGAIEVAVKAANATAGRAEGVVNQLRYEADAGIFKGDPGYTPQKGTDYFTAEDKRELVKAVVEALPKYNGEVSNA